MGYQGIILKRQYFSLLGWTLYERIEAKTPSYSDTLLTFVKILKENIQELYFFTLLHTDFF